MPTQNGPCRGQSPAGTKPSPPRHPQTVSGTWFQKEHPQILIQWTVNPPSRGNPDYKAEVGVYRLIFDTEFPVLHQTGSTVPFSVMDPSNETTPYLQGSFVLSQSSPKYPSPRLEVVNLQFPGFKALQLPLFPGFSTESGDTGD